MQDDRFPAIEPHDSGMLDVGGGPGTYSVLISQAFPEIDCTVLDLPEVVNVAQELIERQVAVEGTNDPIAVLIRIRA